MKLSNITEYILEEEFKIIYLKDKLNIINYLKVEHFDSSKIVISHKHGIVDIYGIKLVISKLLKDELLINGIIEKIELRWFVDKFKVNIKGKRINNFLKRLMSLKVELFNIEYISNEEINILINKKDYEKIRKNKTIYKIQIIDKKGFIKLKDTIRKNRILIIFLLIGILFVYLLSNMIFDVKIIHNNEELRNILYDELKENNISIYNFKKNRNDIEKIKKNILKKYKEKIEWLEIEEIGTTYIIRLEERIIPNITIDSTPRHLVAKKNAVIKSIEAISGNVEKLRGEYVKKGDIIISGDITLNENTMNLVHSEGNVYGEVWYVIDVTYPYTYQEEIYTKNKATNLIFQFLSNSFNVLGKKYKYKKVNKEYRISSTFLPIYLSLSKVQEIEKIDYILTCDQAINKALEKGNEKITKKLNEDEYIMKAHVLKSECNNDGAKLEIFYAVLENITDYQIINWK